MKNFLSTLVIPAIAAVVVFVFVRGCVLDKKYEAEPVEEGREEGKQRLRVELVGEGDARSPLRGDGALGGRACPGVREVLYEVVHEGRTPAERIGRPVGQLALTGAPVVERAAPAPGEGLPPSGHARGDRAGRGGGARA